MDSYMTLKALHIIAMVAWFAGLFYLPRLFVYHVDAAANSHSNGLLKTMERKLYYYITTPAMVATWIFGLALLGQMPGWLQDGWLHAKLFLLVNLTLYHFTLGYFRKRFAAGTNTMSEKFFRMWNEVPTVLLILIVLLASLKPF